MAAKHAVRNRGVCLTSDATRLLEEKLQEQWEKSGSSRKLTRRQKADILLINEKTTDRLLSGGRVDRSTVTLAFKSLNVKWNDSFLAEEKEEAGQDTAADSSKKSIMPWILIGTAVVIILIGVLSNPLEYRPKERIVASTNWRREFFAGLERGTAAYQAGDYERASEEFNLLETSARKHNDVTCLAEVTRMKADVLMVNGQFESAISHYKEALKGKEQVGESITYPALQQALGVAYQKNGQLKEAKVSLLKSLNGYIAYNDQSGIAIVQADLGALSLEEGDDSSALAWFASARSGSDRGVNLGLLMDVKSQEAVIYARQANLDKARRMLHDCLNFWRQEKHVRWIALTELRMALVEVGAGNNSKAKGLLTSSLAGYEQVKDANGVNRARQLLAVVSKKNR